MWNRFKAFDPLLFFIPLILIGISVTLIYALTYDASGASLALRQGVYGVVGIIGMLLLTFFDYRNLRGWAPWLYALGLLALAAVEIPGVGAEVFGATRWIDLGFFQFQPGEMEKAIIIICLSALLARAGQRITTPVFFTALLALVVPAVTILLQPDLGTALVSTVCGIVILFHTKLKRSHWVILLTGIIAVASIMVLSFKEVRPFNKVLKEYQKDRLASFIDPSRDKDNTGYNIVQSKIAVGSGGLVGKGFKYSSQSQLHFLPVAHADFIFAALAVVWGLVGSYGIIALYIVLILRILHAAQIAKDQFGMLLCVGIVTKLLFEVVVNIGMNIGIMPVTGIPLPLMSYGGTTMLTNLLLLGVAQSIVIRYKRLTF